MRVISPVPVPLSQYRSIDCLFSAPSAGRPSIEVSLQQFAAVTGTGGFEHPASSAANRKNRFMGAPYRQLLKRLPLSLARPSVGSSAVSPTSQNQDSSSPPPIL